MVKRFFLTKSNDKYVSTNEPTRHTVFIDNSGSHFTMEFPIMGYRHIKDVPEVIPQQELIFKREPENS